MNKEDGLKASSTATWFTYREVAHRAASCPTLKHQTGRLFAVLVLVTECSDNTKSTLNPEANDKTKQKKKERPVKSMKTEFFSVFNF